MMNFQRLMTFSVLVFSLLFTSVSNAFVTFETGHVRPLALSPDGSQLFAVNTPDGYLEIFDIKTDGLNLTATLPVGLEPVSVAARNNDEVWVINHLSDSISIVDVSVNPPLVIRTLLVGDEPRDIVFAGPGGNRAFITTAHRGQNSPYTSITDPGELTTEGIGRADVWVFDATSVGSALGGTPLTVVTLFGDTPRALAVSPDGSTVYAAVFHSGNQTTTIHEDAVCDGGVLAASCAVSDGTAPGGLPLPNKSHDDTAAPETGLIVKYDGTNWKDELGRNWDDMVRFDLPDMDVFAIDADAALPVETQSFTGVGTILFDMAVHPVSGKLFVSNTEAFNHIRFEGTRVPGVLIDGVEPTTVVGHLHETRITIIDPQTSSITPRHINKHIDYNIVPAPAGTAEKSLGLPRSLVLSSDGSTLYLAAKGSDEIGVFNTSQIEDDSFIPDSSDHIAVSGGGPAGLVLDDSNNRLYVTTRFDNGISVIDTSTQSEVNHYLLNNPEPADVIAGRRFLHDARLTSSNGEAACGSCHVDGDLDSLAWDLGDPTGNVINNPGPNTPAGGGTDFHPMKGPMTTQTLRGMDNHGPMHWRSDRTGGNDEANSVPDGGSFNEDLAFKKFNVAFAGLNGRSGPLTAPEMQAFTDYILQVLPPPNPIRNLDDSLTAMQANGESLFGSTKLSIGILNCDFCHVIDNAQGQFGSDGRNSAVQGEPQNFKHPQLRNMYAKAGMFGMPNVEINRPDDDSHQGDQVRGFGYLHDGSVDTMFHFVRTLVFEDIPDADRRDLEQFMFAFDANLKPVVGQQITLTDTNAATVGGRIGLMQGQAVIGNNDLVVHGTVNGAPWRAARQANGNYQPDDINDAELTQIQVRILAQTPGQNITYTAVPLNSATLFGLDRDQDGIFNRNDVCPSFADPLQLDGDLDDVGDLCDNCPLDSNTDQADNEGDGIGDVCDSDDDNDNLSDVFEISWDGDGGSYNPLTDLNPLVKDTDGDGFNDDVEVAQGSNPLDINDTPATGDINENGVLDLGDIMLAMRFSIGLATPTAQQLLRTDVAPQSGGLIAPDGEVTMMDVLQLQMMYFDNLTQI